MQYKKEYTAVPGSGFTEQDAQIIGPELERLAGLGVTTPDGIMDAAQDEASPLHPYFEWDNKAAAAKYREWQAAQRSN